MKGELGVKGGIRCEGGSEAMRAAFPDPKPAFWNPVDDLFAYGRAARSYLPLDLGGSDLGPPGGRVYEASLLCAGTDPRPVRLRFRQSWSPNRPRTGFAPSLPAAWPSPSSNRQPHVNASNAGNFRTRPKTWLPNRTRFSLGWSDLRNIDANQIKEWIETADQLYQDLEPHPIAWEHRQDRRGAGPGADREPLAAVRSAAPHRQGVCGSGSGGGVIPPAGVVQGTEQAGQLQTRLERTTGPEADRLKAETILAWKTSLAAWRTYEQYAAAHAGVPGRAAHASALRGCAPAKLTLNPRRSRVLVK